MPPRLAVFAIALLLPLSASPALAQIKTEVVDVKVRPGVTMRYLAVSAGVQPKAAVILLAGGDNVLRLSRSGSIGTNLNLNFLIRSRELFAREGFHAVALDAASDRQKGMDGSIRLAPQYAQDVGKVIADVKQRTGAPVWLISNSSSTLSAVGAGAHLSSADEAMRPRGIVLTSVQTTLSPGLCGKTVYDGALGSIRMPVLVVSHRDDGCKCSPGSAAVGARLLTALKQATAKEHRIFTGGSQPLSGPCDARAPHGFFGIEGSVVKAIADWIKGH
jgi:hypothetical protein